MVLVGCDAMQDCDRSGHILSHSGNGAIEALNKGLPRYNAPLPLCDSHYTGIAKLLTEVPPGKQSNYLYLLVRKSRTLLQI